MNKLLYTIWLSLACTPGAETFAKLNNRFSSPEDIYNADKEEIAACISSKSRDYNSLIDKDIARAEKVLTFCISKNVGILTYYDSSYPNSLRNIKNPPVLLYYRGKNPDFNSDFFVSIVGTRRLTDYGRKNTFSVAADLALAGATIVSGMAIGIDSVAHAGALSEGKTTVAVIGSGIDVCYPAQHKRLAQEIVKSGCVMTEYAPGTRPEKHNFPLRNRIISGLCSATVVFEGRENSGALITARYAKEQGREVFVLPGHVGSPGSEISNLLLKEGAKACTRAEDVLSVFEKDFPTVINQFMLRDRCPVDMLYSLRQLEVVANCPTDDIYIPVKQRKRTEKTLSYEKASRPPRSVNECRVTIKKSEPQTEEKSSSSAELSSTNSEIFSADALKIYKRIPFDRSCEIESLVDEQTSLREVMKHLLNLEMGKFVTLLPGGIVTRKTK